MTSDELQAWNEAISESFAQGEVYTVQSTPAGSVRAVAVSEVENSFIIGQDLDGKDVIFDRETGFGYYDAVSTKAVSTKAVSTFVSGITDAWDLKGVNPGVSYSLITGPCFGYAPYYGLYSLAGSANYYKFSSSRTYNGSYGGQGTDVEGITGDVVLNLFWNYGSSKTGWKGAVGYTNYSVTYPLQSLGQQIALDSYVNFYQSWWYHLDASSNQIKERMRVKPSRVYLQVNSGLYADGSTIYQAEDGSKFVFHCDDFVDGKGWHVYITDESGSLAAMSLPYVINKIGFSFELGSEDSCPPEDDGSFIWDSSAMVNLDPVSSFGWSVADVFLWMSGDGFVFGDAASGTDLSAVIDAINQNTLTTADGCAQIVDAVNSQGGQIVDAIGGLSGKIASGLTPSEDDVKSGVSSVQSKFAASYGNTKSLVDMVENLYITLKDGFSGASEVTTWDFPGIKVKLNGTVHTICPEMSVQKTDIGMQQYLVLVVRVICVIALVWMIWNKVHRVIVPKEADD